MKISGGIFSNSVQRIKLITLATSRPEERRPFNNKKKRLFLHVFFNKTNAFTERSYHVWKFTFFCILFHQNYSFMLIILTLSLHYPRNYFLSSKRFGSFTCAGKKLLKSETRLYLQRWSAKSEEIIYLHRWHS